MLWEPDPTCEHEENEDCEHFGIWVGTRLAHDTIERGTMVLDLRELDDDDDGDDDVTIAQGIVVACALETGAIEPLGREGAIFLRHHQWLVASLRAEVDFFRRRAARAAAQRDRETAAKHALAIPARSMVAYHKLFPSDWDLLPIRDGERYWAIDLYCRNPDCTCTSSVITFYRLDDGEPLLIGEVVVDYAERDIEFQANNQTVDELFGALWNACEYRLRARHDEARDAVRRFAPRAGLAPQLASAAPGLAPQLAPAAPLDRVPRNAACPCGSGKKFKRCCLDATRGAGA